MSICFSQITTQEELDVPGPVSDLKARPTSSFSILIQWDKPVYSSSYVRHYKLYYRQVGGRRSWLNQNDMAMIAQFMMIFLWRHIQPRRKGEMEKVSHLMDSLLWPSSPPRQARISGNPFH